MTPPAMPPWPHTIAILAGGESRRMGVPKHELRRPDGRTLADLALACAQSMTTRIIVSGSKQVLRGLEHIADKRAEAGPLGGIEAILESGRDDRYLFIPCDMPRLVPAMLRKLVDGLDEAVAVTFEHGGEGVRPVLPLALKAIAINTLRETIERGDRSVHALLDSLETREISINPEDRPCLANINTPGDWSDYLQSTS